MIVNVMAFNGKKFSYEIKDEKNLRGIVVTVISGDHAITPLYEDGSFDHMYDPNRKMRKIDYYDGSFFIEAPNIEDYNNLIYADDLYDVDWAEHLNKIEEEDI